MKKLNLLIINTIIIFYVINLSACNFEDSIFKNNTTNRFEIYKTENMWNFLELDTKTGLIWQIQYSVENNRLKSILNETELVRNGKVGQFKLIPTTNMWNFLLIDQIRGDVWQVQYSLDSSKRMMIPISM